MRRINNKATSPNLLNLLKVKAETKREQINQEIEIEDIVIRQINDRVLKIKKR